MSRRQEIRHACFPPYVAATFSGSVRHRHVRHFTLCVSLFVDDTRFGICPVGLMIGESSHSNEEPRAASIRSPLVRNVSVHLSFPLLELTWRKTMSLEANETGNLIGSDKVEGTAVYGADSNKIGSIERVMIDKKSGRVSYAVLSFGGFLGIGDDHYPLPWQSLKYDTSLGGYRTGITETQLKGAPKYSNDNAWNWNDPARTRAVNDYYGVPMP